MDRINCLASAMTWSVWSTQPKEVVRPRISTTKVAVSSNSKATVLIPVALLLLLNPTKRGSQAEDLNHQGRGEQQQQGHGYQNRAAQQSLETALVHIDSSVRANYGAKVLD